MAYLFYDRHVSPRTVEGYRSALSLLLRSAAGLDIGNNEFLCTMIKGMYQLRPLTRSVVPSWDLTIVLEALTKPPFEPLLSCSNKHLTLKTVFLVALASGARRGELHSLARSRLSFQVDGEWVDLRPKLGFRAKTHLSKHPDSAFLSIRLPALPDPDNSLLCPVRALRQYLVVTKTFDIAPGQDHLFISFRGPVHKPVALCTISNWIKQTVLLSYSLAGIPPPCQRQGP